MMCRAPRQTFADDLKALGKPDTEAGQQAKSELDTLAGELNTDVAKVKSAVDGLQARAAS